MKEIIVASYAGKKPFKTSGDGYKDYLIFSSILNNNESESEIHFATANHKDFCDNSGALHPELQSMIPSHQVVHIHESVQALNSAILIPKLKTLKKIANSIKKGTFEGFDLGESLSEVLHAQLCAAPYDLDHLGLPMSEPTGDSIQGHEVSDLTVKQLADGVLLFDLEGLVDLEVSGFIDKSEFYHIHEGEIEDIYVSNPDWNDYVMAVSTTREFGFAMSVVFDQAEKVVTSVSVEVAALETR